MTVNESANELLVYPFDQYQRYQDVRQLMKIVQPQIGSEKPTVLDLGGSPTALKFLSDYDIISANLEYGQDIHVQCDGACLPFPANSFDIITNVDTLEHVPAPRRETFVREIMRVTRQFAFITGPFANGYNEKSEAVLYDFMVNVLGADHRFLREHIQRGLPDLEECIRWIQDATPAVVAIPSGYTHHWLPLMLIRQLLARLSKGRELMIKLDQLVNFQAYWSDHKLPSYRHIVVAAKQGSIDVLDQAVALFAAQAEEPAPDLNGVIGLWKAVEWLPALREQDQEISDLRAENRRLQKLVSGYESGRLMRFLAFLRSLIG